MCKATISSFEFFEMFPTEAKAMGGFNSRILGDNAPTGHPYCPKRYAGWQLADEMINKGKLFYANKFRHLKMKGGTICEGWSFEYGGTQVCNDCGRKNIAEDWWKVKVFKDGNAWICIGEDFENLQESDNYSFGDTRDEALKNYQSLFLKENNNEKERQKETRHNSEKTPE